MTVAASKVCGCSVQWQHSVHSTALVIQPTPWRYLRPREVGGPSVNVYLRIAPDALSGRRRCRKTPAFPAASRWGRSSPTYASRPTVSSAWRSARVRLVSPRTAGSPTAPPSSLWPRPLLSAPPRRSVDVIENNRRHRHVTAIAPFASQN